MTPIATLHPDAVPLTIPVDMNRKSMLEREIETAREVCRLEGIGLSFATSTVDCMRLVDGNPVQFQALILTAVSAGDAFTMAVGDDADGYDDATVVAHVRRCVRVWMQAARAEKTP